MTGQQRAGALLAGLVLLAMLTALAIGIWRAVNAEPIEAPTRGDVKGWVDQSRPVAAALAGAHSLEAGPCSPVTGKGRALNHGWAPGPPGGEIR